MVRVVHVVVTNRWRERVRVVGSMVYGLDGVVCTWGNLVRGRMDAGTCWVIRDTGVNQWCIRDVGTRCALGGHELAGRVDTG